VRYEIEVTVMSDTTNDVVVAAARVRAEKLEKRDVPAVPGAGEQRGMTVRVANV
jgi:hypothetical protein